MFIFSILLILIWDELEINIANMKLVYCFDIT